MKVPIVMISFQDHSANLEGVAEAYQFLAIGFLIKEDKNGYTLGHWIDVTDSDGDKSGEVTTYIAKVKGLKKTQIGAITL